MGPELFVGWFILYHCQQTTPSEKVLNSSTHDEITDKVKHGKELLEYKNFGVVDDFAFTLCAFIFGFVIFSLGFWSSLQILRVSKGRICGCGRR